MNRKSLFLIFISLLWIVTAILFIFSNQSILSQGVSVLLETVPVDPRDFLRGDYVILRYKISNLDLNQIESENPYYRHGETVYVKLEQKNKFWEAVSIRTKRGADSDGLFIRGRVKYSYGKNIGVDYGIESYFVPEGEGKNIEASIRNRNAVEVEVMVDSTGKALIKKVAVR